MRVRLGSFVVVIWLLLIAGVVNARWRVVRDARLHDATPPTKPVRLRLTDLWSGRFQAEVERRFTAWWGLRGIAVKTDNTINLEVFAETRPGSTVVVGDGGWLFSAEDTNFLNRTDDCPACDALAVRLGRAQRALAATGRVLVPILTASKTTTERDRVPERWRRFDGPPRSDAITRRFVAALRREGVDFVDGWELEMALRRESGRSIFPRRGRHWAPYPACRVFAEAIALGARRLGVALGPGDVPPCAVDMRGQNNPEDLGSVMNVWHIPYRMPVDEPPPPPPIRTDVRPVLIGTSFLWDFARLLRVSSFGTDARYYYYDDVIFDVTTQRLVGDVVANDAEWRRWTLSRNLFLVDLYEVYLPEAGYGPFLDQLDAALADVPYTGPSR